MQFNLSAKKATLLGCTAPITWGLSVSFIKGITDYLGVGRGLAITYTLSFIIVFFLFGLPNLKKIPWKYYFCGLGSAITCSMSFAFSLALSKGGTQAMEVGMINYLWPSLTILFAVIFNHQKAKWWLGIGMLGAIYGICIVLSRNVLVDFKGMYFHILENPLSYFLGLTAAISWAAYSNFTKAWSRGENPTVLVFAADVIIFNVLNLSGVEVPKDFTWFGLGIAVLAALVLGFAYGFWTIGVQKGNITILSIVSYFTPVLSCVFASIFIGAQLTGAFWIGVGMVVVASFICWRATI
ncbi:aromatic amino acid DMT transporter YddG [Turicimonas muris]|uniref:aromatic amino acid DMT transporter YddG n=1 Tax=Turicimonas muris TaxID=1796652 RepID=UPI0026749E64|nr:aromatic amino acid DMT transporter YddG [Turicimonas muris]